MTGTEPQLSRRALGWSAAVHGLLLLAVLLASRIVTNPPPALQPLPIEATVVTRAETAAARPRSVPRAPRETPALTRPSPTPVPPPKLTEAPAPKPAEAPSPKPPVKPVAKPAVQPQTPVHDIPRSQHSAPPTAPSAPPADPDKAQREAELRANLAAEERTDALRASGALSAWTQNIRAKVERAWLRPPSATAALDCNVRVTQVPGGEVVRVELQTCNGDASARESIEAAVYRASPLPQPPDAALFERIIEFRFHPSE